MISTPDDCFWTIRPLTWLLELLKCISDFYKICLYFKSALSPLLIWSSGLFGNPVKALTVWVEPNQMQLGGSGTHNYHTITGKWIFEIYLFTTQHQDILQSNFRSEARRSESANLKERFLHISTVQTCTRSIYCWFCVTWNACGQHYQLLTKRAVGK